MHDGRHPKAGNGAYRGGAGEEEFSLGRHLGVRSRVRHAGIILEPLAP